MTRDWSAIVLAGGRAHRMAGTDKIRAEVGGQAVLQRALAACAGHRVVVVGPPELADLLSANVLLEREDPPFDGPVAAVRAGLAALATDGKPVGHIALLAGDQPRLDPAALAALDTLLTASGADAATLTDETGHRQFLCAMWAPAALGAALARAGNSMRSVYATARVVDLPDTWGASRDIDTPADLSAARNHFGCEP